MWLLLWFLAALACGAIGGVIAEAVIRRIRYREYQRAVEMRHDPKWNRVFADTLKELDDETPSDR